MISDSLDLLISLQGGKVRYKFFVVNNASLADTCPGFDGNCKNSCFASRVVETPEIEIHTLDYLTARAIAHNWVGSGPQGAASRAETKHRNYRTPDSDSLQFSLCLRSPPYDARNPLYCICLSVNPEVGLKLLILGIPFTPVSVWSP